ncbi:hypothetical protein HYH02_009363 [Chlamydomonas schloesseri]|uniref:Uncharacterized protein n=1 Tax=Chlamydomonas schloesseri TaxID=2026947 RepID=A0A835W9J0_9CHLO|nr:hypothetical protein HYH02_009363 [Chlamydomonas schloesseri]|eukprot:KAG2443293.1 hypothetical protein HYH02_009363 [Chlamydomonas schloesseri]
MTPAEAATTSAPQAPAGPAPLAVAVDANPFACVAEFMEEHPQVGQGFLAVLLESGLQSAIPAAAAPAAPAPASAPAVATAWTPGQLPAAAAAAAAAFSPHAMASTAATYPGLSAVGAAGTADPVAMHGLLPSTAQQPCPAAGGACGQSPVGVAAPSYNQQSFMQMLLEDGGASSPGAAAMQQPPVLAVGALEAAAAAGTAADRNDSGLGGLRVLCEAMADVATLPDPQAVREEAVAAAAGLSGAAAGAPMPAPSGGRGLGGSRLARRKRRAADQIAETAMQLINGLGLGEVVQTLLSPAARNFMHDVQLPRAVIDATAGWMTQEVACACNHRVKSVEVVRVKSVSEGRLASHLQVVRTCNAGLNAAAATGAPALPLRHPLHHVVKAEYHPCACYGKRAPPPSVFELTADATNGPICRSGTYLQVEVQQEERAQGLACLSEAMCKKLRRKQLQNSVLPYLRAKYPQYDLLLGHDEIFATAFITTLESWEQASGGSGTESPGSASGAGGSAAAAAAAAAAGGGAVEGSPPLAAASPAGNASPAGTVLAAAAAAAELVAGVAGGEMADVSNAAAGAEPMSLDPDVRYG